MDVLEVGPGTGYFSIHFAKYLNKGKLYLLDIQQEMLEIAEKRIERKGMKNVEYKITDGNAIDYQNNSFDRIFLVAVFGEIENKRTYLTEFNRIMKTGGLLSISEMWGDPDKLSIDQINELMKGTGFKFYKLYGKKCNYTVIYRKYKKIKDYE